MNRRKGIAIDDQSGSVTVSRDELIDAAIPELEAIIAEIETDDLPQALQKHSAELAEAVAQLTGQVLNGFPIAVPIYLKATDGDGKGAELQYFVVVLDLDLEMLAEKLQSDE